MRYFKAKMHQIWFWLGLRLDPTGELTAFPQTSLLDLKGPTSKGREGRAKGREGILTPPQSNNSSHVPDIANVYCEPPNIP